MTIKAYRDLADQAQREQYEKMNAMLYGDAKHKRMSGVELIADIERRLREQETFEVRHPIASILVMVLGLSIAMAVIIGYMYLGYGWGL